MCSQLMDFNIQNWFHLLNLVKLKYFLDNKIRQIEPFTLFKNLPHMQHFNFEKKSFLKKLLICDFSLWESLYTPDFFLVCDFLLLIFFILVKIFPLCDISLWGIFKILNNFPNIGQSSFYYIIFSNNKALELDAVN